MSIGTKMEMTIKFAKRNAEIRNHIFTKKSLNPTTYTKENIEALFSNFNRIFYESGYEIWTQYLENLEDAQLTLKQTLLIDIEKKPQNHRCM